MTTLEEILQDYMGCKKPFRKDGTFTYRGAKAYNKLIALLDCVGELTLTNMNRPIRVLDEISSTDIY